MVAALRDSMSFPRSERPMRAPIRILAYQLPGDGSLTFSGLVFDNSSFLRPRPRSTSQWQDEQANHQPLQRDAPSVEIAKLSGAPRPRRR